MGKIKICGIHKLDDALLAVEAGADAIGLLVGQAHTSSDFIEPAQAREIVAALPPFITAVLVTHLTTAAEVARLLDQTLACTAQLHGDIPPEDCLRLRESHPHVKLLKSVHVTDGSCLTQARPYLALVDALLPDSVNAATNQIGGTGLTHDWSLSAQLVRASHKPIILAGGLHPDNVAQAIATVAPYGVDVNSGVKNTGGGKSSEKMMRFVRAARSAFAALESYA